MTHTEENPLDHPVERIAIDLKWELVEAAAPAKYSPSTHTTPYWLLL